MDKFAQERSWFDRAREKYTPSGIGEKYFDPQFKNIMDSIRLTDDTVRSIVAGSKQGEADAPEDARSLKKILNAAESYYNRLEYVAAITEVMKFSKKMQEVANVLAKLNINIDEIHQQFLFKDVDPDTLKYISDEFKPKTSKYKPQIIKEAGIWDSISNRITDRGRALKFWEEKYPQQTRELKKQLAYMIKLCRKFLATVLSNLKDMNKARIKRNLEGYIKSAENITKDQKDFMDEYNEFNKKQVEGFVKKYIASQPKSETRDETKSPEQIERAKSEKALEIPLAELQEAEKEINKAKKQEPPKDEVPKPKAIQEVAKDVAKKESPTAIDSGSYDPKDNSTDKTPPPPPPPPLASELTDESTPVVQPKPPSAVSIPLAEKIKKITSKYAELWNNIKPVSGKKLPAAFADALTKITRNEYKPNVINPFIIEYKSRSDRSKYFAPLATSFKKADIPEIEKYYDIQGELSGDTFSIDKLENVSSEIYDRNSGDVITTKGILKLKDKKISKDSPAPSASTQQGEIIPTIVNPAAATISEPEPNIKPKDLIEAKQEAEKGSTITPSADPAVSTIPPLPGSIVPPSADPAADKAKVDGSKTDVKKIATEYAEIWNEIPVTTTGEFDGKNFLRRISNYSKVECKLHISSKYKSCYRITSDFIVGTYLFPININLHETNIEDMKELYTIQGDLTNKGEFIIDKMIRIAVIDAQKMLHKGIVSVKNKVSTKPVEPPIDAKITPDVVEEIKQVTEDRSKSENTPTPNLVEEIERAKEQKSEPKTIDPLTEALNQIKEPEGDLSLPNTNTQLSDAAEETLRVIREEPAKEAPSASSKAEHVDLSNFGFSPELEKEVFLESCIKIWNEVRLEYNPDSPQDMFIKELELAYKKANYVTEKNESIWLKIFNDNKTMFCIVPEIYELTNEIANNIAKYYYIRKNDSESLDGFVLREMTIAAYDDGEGISTGVIEVEQKKQKSRVSEIDPQIKSSQKDLMIAGKEIWNGVQSQFSSHALLDELPKVFKTRGFNIINRDGTMFMCSKDNDVFCVVPSRYILNDNNMVKDVNKYYDLEGAFDPNNIMLKRIITTAIYTNVGGMYEIKKGVIEATTDPKDPVKRLKEKHNTKEKASIVPAKETDEEKQERLKKQKEEINRKFKEDEEKKRKSIIAPSTVLTPAGKVPTIDSKMVSAKLPLRPPPNAKKE